MTREELTNLIIDYGKQIYSFCCYLTRNEMEADDLYQDTILKAVELCHKLNSSGNPKNYLIGISVKLWQNQKKKYALRKHILPLEELKEEKMGFVLEEAKLQPEAQVLRNELQDIVRREIKKLPDKLQIVLFMYYTAEMSLEEIAKALHIPKGTVKSRLFTGRRLLKEKLEVQEYGL